MEPFLACCTLFSQFAVLALADCDSVYLLTDNLAVAVHCLTSSVNAPFPAGS